MVILPLIAVIWALVEFNVGDFLFWTNICLFANNICICYSVLSVVLPSQIQQAKYPNEVAYEQPVSLVM